MANQSAQIDLAVTVNALVDKINVKEAEYKKALAQLENTFKKQQLNIKAPTKITPEVEADLEAFKKATAKIKAALTRDIKESTKLGTVSIGIADAIKKELEQTSSKILPAEGKKVVQGLHKFVSDLLKETDLTKAQKKNLLEGLLTIEGSTLATAKRTISDFQRSVIEGSSKAVETVEKLRKSLDSQADRIKGFRSDVTKGIPENIAAARRDAEALLDLYKVLSKSSGAMALTKDTSKDIDNLEMRISLIKKSMSDLGRLNAMLVKDPSKAVDLGFSFEQGTQKMAVFREALKMTRQALQSIKEEGAAVTSLETATTKAAEAQALANKAKIQQSESYIRLLREQYNAQLALDKKTGDFAKSDIILNRLQVEIDQRKVLDKATTKQIDDAAKYLEALKNVSNAAQLSNELELKARQQLLSLMEKQAVVGLKFTTDELAAEKTLILELEKEISQRNKLDALQARSAENVAALKARNLPVQEQVNLLKEQVKIQEQLQKLTGKESDQIPVLRNMIEQREKILNKLAEEKNLRSQVEKGFEKAANAELVSVEKALSAYKALQEVIVSGGAAARQRFSEEASYVARRVSELEQEIALNKQLKAEKQQLAAIEKSFSGFEKGVKAVTGGGLSLSQYKEAAAQVDQFKQKLSELEKLAVSADANIAASAQHMISVYKQEIAAVEGLLGQEKLLVDLRKAEQKVATAQTDDNRLRALKQQAAAVQELITVLHNQGLAGSTAAKSMEGYHKSLTDQIHSTKELIAESRSLESSYNKLSNVFRSFIRYGVEFAAFYKAQQAITDVAKSVIELEDAFKTVQAVAGATSAEMESVVASIKKVAVDTEFSTNQIAEAAQTLAQAGLAIQDVGAALESTAKFASATGTSLKTSADIMTTMKNVFQDMRFDQIADQLTSTINLSKLTGEGLATILSRAVEVSDTFKIVPEQMQAAFAVLKNAGIKDSTISTGYRQALLELFAPDDKLLTYLQARYAEMGQKLSKETISAMFQSFTQEKNPILAVISELDKLGFATTHASEAARVFDVRAKNVIDVLIKQRDSFASLTTQITAHGTAAQGSKTQMESLGRSWANLGSVVEVIATERMGGLLHSLEKIVDAMSDVIQKSGEMSNAMTRMTGSTGTGIASLSGMLAGLTKFLTSGSLVKGGVAGVGVAGLTNLIDTMVTSFIGKVNESVAKGVSTALEAVSVFFTGKMLWDTLKTRATGGLIAALRALPPQAQIAVAAGGALISTFIALSESVASRIQAIRNDLEKTKAEIDAAKSKQAERAQDKVAFENLLLATERTSQSLQDFIDNNTKAVGDIASVATDAADELRGKSLDLGGSEFAGAIEKLKQATGGLKDSFNPDDYADNVRKVNEIIAQWDGERLKFFDQITKAYETQESERTDDQKRVIEAFEKMSESQKALLLKEITSLDDVKAFTDKEEGFAPKFFEEVVKPVQESTAQYVKDQADLAKALVQQAIEDGEFGKLYSEVLTQFKQGNIELLNQLGKQIEVELQRAQIGLEKQRFSTGGTPEQNKRVEQLTQVANQAQIARMAAGDSAINRSIAALEDIAKHYDQVRDTFISSLSPDQMRELGISQDAVQQHLSALDSATKDLPKEWQDIYRTAVSQGMSYRDISKYLENEKALHKDVPPVIEELLASARKQADLETNINQEIQTKLDKEKEIVSFLDEKKRRQNELEQKEQELKDLLSKGNLGWAQRLEINNQINALQEDQKNLAAEIVATTEKSKVAQNDLDNTVSDQIKLRKEYNEKWRELLRKTDAQARVTEKSISALESERESLLAQGNTKTKAINDVEQKIYELKVREEADRQKILLESLNQNSEFRTKLAEYGNNIARFTEFLKSEGGQGWMKSYPALADGLQALTASVDKSKSAFDDLATNLEGDYSKLSAELQRKMSESSAMATAQFAQQTQGISTDPKLAGNEAERESRLTQVVIAELATRRAAQQDYYTQLQKQRDTIHLKELDNLKTAKMTESEALNKLKQINTAYFDGKRSLLLEDFNAHKQNLDALYAEEKKHADRVRALDNELLNLKRSDAEDVNSIVRDLLSEEDQMYFDRKVSAQEYYDAKKLLAQGDYENGRSLIDKAISDQVAYTKEVSKAEQEGRVAYGTTADAMSDLLEMQGARTKAVMKQREVEEAARKASEEAAKAELKQMQDLTTAINTLNTLIAKIAHVDLGLQQQIDAAKALNEELKKTPTAPVSNTSSSAVTPQSMGEAYTKDIDAQRQFYNSLVLTNAELAKHGSEIVKIIDAQGRVQTTTALAASAMDLEGKSVSLLNDATAAANVTHNNLAASAETVGAKTAGAAAGADALASSTQAAGQSATEAAQGADALAKSVDNIPKEAKVDVNAETTQATDKIGVVDTATTDLNDKETKPVIDADGQPAEDELNSVLDFFTQVFNNLNAWKIPIDADTSAAFTAIQAVDDNISKPRYMTVYVNEVKQNAGGDTGGGNYALGGLIRGKGTGTSDSIPAMLSNGEYVIPADAVKQVGVDYLDKIKNGEIKHFASGGYAASSKKSDDIALQILKGTFKGTPSDPAFLKFVKDSPKGSIIASQYSDQLVKQAEAQGGKAVRAYTGVDFIDALQVVRGEPSVRDNIWFGGTLGGKRDIVRIFSKDELQKLQEAELKASTEKKVAKERTFEKPAPELPSTPRAEAQTPRNPFDSIDMGKFQMSEGVKQELAAMAERFMEGDFSGKENLSYKYSGKNFQEILQGLVTDERFAYYKDIMDKSSPDVPVGMSAGGGRPRIQMDQYPTIPTSSSVTKSLDGTVKQPSVQSQTYTITIRNDVGQSASLQGSNQQVDQLLGVLKSIKGVTIQ